MFVYKKELLFDAENIKDQKIIPIVKQNGQSAEKEKNNQPARNKENNSNPILVDFDFSDEFSAYTAGVGCKYDISDLPTYRNLTEKQEKTLEIAQQYCLNWYAYFDDLSGVKKKELERQHKNISNDFMRFAPHQFSNEKLKEAKELVLDTTNNFHDTSALNYLLTSDFDLIKVLAQEINTEDIQYILRSETLL